MMKFIPIALKKIALFMHCDYPQWGSFTVPGRDFSGLTAFGLFGEGLGNDLLTDSIFLHPSLPSPFPQNNNYSPWHCVSHSVCRFWDCLPTGMALLLGETRKSHTPFPWFLEDDACFMLSGLNMYIYRFLQYTPSMIFMKSLKKIYFGKYFVKSKSQGTAFPFYCHTHSSFAVTRKSFG